MTNMEKIIKCERKYLECFCKATEQQDFIRFEDELLPDMYYHNYTWIKSAKDDSALLHIIESEIIHSKNMHRDFCFIRCHIPVNDSISALLSHKHDVSVSGYYLFDVPSLSKLNSNLACCIQRVDKPEMFDDILRLDLEHDEDSLGRDFCERRVYRRKDVYLSGEGVDSYICYDNSGAVGNCDLFVYGDTAKIEDFAILPQKQNKGYGTVLLKTLIGIALEKNATTIYLETDEDEMAKEMYRKRGFTKVHEISDLLFEL